MAIELKNFRVENIVFEEAQNRTYASNSFHRIPIKYIDNGKKTELCIATNPLMTWGVQENRKKQCGPDGPVEYYSLPLVVADAETREVMEKIFQCCRDHLSKQSVAVSVQRFNMIPAAMNPFYVKRDKTTGDIIPDAPPTLYPKLISVYQRVRNPDVAPEIATEFVDTNENPIDPISMIGCRANVIAAITVKEIYIGAGQSIQLKVNDAIVIERLEVPSRRLKGFFKKPETCVLDDMVTGASTQSKEKSEEKIEDAQPIVKINRLIKRKQ